MPSSRASLSVRKGAEGSNGKNPALRTALGSVNFYLPFFHYLAVPKNTTQTEYLSHTMILPVSQTERLWVGFPEGCKGLVGLQLWRGVEQIFPLPAGVWFRSDGAVVNFRLSHVIDKEPYNIEIRGYNEDDTYQHTPWVSLELHGLERDVPPVLQGFIDFVRET